MTITQIRAQSHLDDDLFDTGWGLLERMKLVRAGDARGEWYTVDADAALAMSIDRQVVVAAELLQSVQRAAEVTQVILGKIRPAAARARDDVSVNEYVDKVRRDRAMADFLESVRNTADSMHPGPMPEDMSVLDASLRMDAATIRRGVTVRAIYPQEVLEDPRYCRYLHQLADVGADVRLIDHAPDDLLIFDGHTVLVPGDQPASTSMGVITGFLASHWVKVYNDYWTRSVPLATLCAGASSSSALITSQERQIIRLMLTGLSDDQIARQLGIHRRTVLRRVTELIERFEVNNRFQLGHKLASALDDTAPV
jgi:DNA-binding CsgD family transcriptional regulator